MLEPGRCLCGFEILAPLGAGGMGEVYLARDRRLGRDVALKVLPQPVASDAMRLARFESEARILASLNDPGIATIFGLEECDDLRFLVLEYVPGETLAETLKRGPMPVARALTTGRQVALALEAAHAKGIVHRDLKCGNVKITPAGVVKLLDFGLAKAFVDDDPFSDPEASTHANDLTATGTILGTAAYMSPEQARGQAVDPRTDIWSFGCVLYELLAGKAAFAGQTRSDTLVAVLDRDPDWQALPRRTPAGVRSLLRRCLQRDRDRRVHHVADVRIEIEDALNLTPATRLRAALMPLRGGWRLRGLAVAALVVVVGLVALGTHVPMPAAHRPQPRLQIQMPAGMQSSDLGSGKTPLVLSPDGTRLVFAAGPSGSRRLYERVLAELDVKPLPGTEGGDNPFFSPDGQWVGFDADGKLKKMRLPAGETVVLCDVAGLRGASWGSDGSIVFAASVYSGLFRVSSAGGTPQPLTTLIKGQEISHRWPHVLPGGHHVLFSVMSPNGREDERTIAVVSLADGRRRTLLKGGSYPLYLPALGCLLFGRSGALVAVPFDLERLEIRGPQVTVLENVLMWSKTAGTVYADVSRDGTLAFTPAEPPRQQKNRLVWIDRDGLTQPLALPPGPYEDVALAPDGRRVAVTVSGPTDDIYIYDLERETQLRLTFEADNAAPAWSPDGQHVAFVSTRNGPRNVFQALSDGSAPAEQLTHSPRFQNLVSYSSDGNAVLFTDQTEAGSDIYWLPLGGADPPQPVVASPAIELFPALSPDGRWLAYTSTESLREEVYVRSFPGPGAKYPISNSGGSQPIWAHDGEELFYRKGNAILAARITREPHFGAGTPRVVFDVPFDLGGVDASYAVAPDGQRALVVDRDGEKHLQSPQIVVVPNWLEELRGKLK